MLFKLLMYIVIAYLAYKLLKGPKKLNPPSDRDRLDRRKSREDYSDYEEID